ncbi:hypothetical protein QTP88_027555 [Uroleucon formosanum]
MFQQKTEGIHIKSMGTDGSSCGYYLVKQPPLANQRRQRDNTGTKKRKTEDTKTRDSNAKRRPNHYYRDDDLQPYETAPDGCNDSIYRSKYNCQRSGEVTCDTRRQPEISANPYYNADDREHSVHEAAITEHPDLDHSSTKTANTAVRSLLRTGIPSVDEQIPSTAVCCWNAPTVDLPLRPTKRLFSEPTLDVPPSVCLLRRHCEIGHIEHDLLEPVNE